MPTSPFHRKPAPEIRRTATSATQSLDFTADFTDPDAADAYNIADAILYGFDYAVAPERRAPGETDYPAQLAVLSSRVNVLTHFDPTTRVLRINTSLVRNNFNVLHEYSHNLEERLSSFYGVATCHDGFFFRGGLPTNTKCETGADLSSANVAWMEGFANYFPLAVDEIFPGKLNYPFGARFGTLPSGRIEAPGACPAGALAPHANENGVAAAVFDIIDPIGAKEPSDRLCRTPENPIDDKVFQVFDRLEIGFANRTLQQFVDGWSARGFDLPTLRAAFGTETASGLVKPAPLPRYDTSPAANLAVWRPADGVWYALGAAVGTQWGASGDTPLSRDYDGDGLTDPAVFRPGDENWYLMLSATNRPQVVQWGQVGDIPLPGD